MSYNEYYNSYIEIIIKKTKTAVDYLKIVGILLMTFLLLWFFVASSFVIGGIFSFLLEALTVFLAYLLLLVQNVEYEYNFTMGDLDIAAIYSKRKRRRLVDIKCNHMEDFSEYNESAKQKIKTKVNGKVIHAISNQKGAKLYSIIYHGVDEKKNALIFEPNEEMASAIQKQFSRIQATGQNR